MGGLRVGDDGDEMMPVDAIALRALTRSLGRCKKILLRHFGCSAINSQKMTSRKKVLNWTATPPAAPCHDQEESEENCCVLLPFLPSPDNFRLKPETQFALRRSLFFLHRYRQTEKLLVEVPWI